MSADRGIQLDAFVTPGALLKAARESRGLSPREVADLLHLMPGYPAIIERDDYKALRHPAFARGYVKAYGKLVGVEEKRLLDAYDRLRGEEEQPPPRTVQSRPLRQRRYAGPGVVVGLVLLALLVTAVWWWRTVPPEPAPASASPADAGVMGPAARDYSGTVDE
ncbi:MAG: helix-turn-helix domain-containing protein [Halioglobus sp.]|nr:helix-turn-helix domain-containing protein [Halioglobus sp.]